MHICVNGETGIRVQGKLAVRVCATVQLYSKHECKFRQASIFNMASNRQLQSTKRKVEWRYLIDENSLKKLITPVQSD